MLWELFPPSIFTVPKPSLCVILFYVKIKLFHTNIKENTFTGAMCCQKPVCVLFWTFGAPEIPSLNSGGTALCPIKCHLMFTNGLDGAVS